MAFGGHGDQTIEGLRIDARDMARDADGPGPLADRERGGAIAVENFTAARPLRRGCRPCPAGPELASLTSMSAVSTPRPRIPASRRTIAWGVPSGAAARRVSRASLISSICSLSTRTPAKCYRYGCQAPAEPFACRAAVGVLALRFPVPGEGDDWPSAFPDVNGPELSPCQRGFTDWPASMCQRLAEWGPGGVAVPGNPPARSA